MNNTYYLPFLFLFFISCSEPKNIENNDEDNPKLDTGDSTLIKTDLIEESDDVDYKESTITVDAKVLSVEERLIMPSDYFTTVMTVATEAKDTLVFMSMDGLGSLVGETVSIEYIMLPGSDLIVCFDCTSFDEDIIIYDIAAKPSDVGFISLKLVKYTPDEYVIPASTFLMINEKEETMIYNSNDNDLIKDSTKMSNGFYKYGVITKWYPELKNYDELKKLVE